MLARGSISALTGLFLCVMAGPGSAQSGADPKIGVAAATKNEVQGIRGVEKRELASGSEIFLNEAVKTGDDSVAQLVFLDNTNLSVGPGSLVELDKFVYDPDRKLGQIAVEIGRGAFRFVTGLGSSKNYSLKTPHATLGIRGTVFELVSTDEEVKIKLNHGLIQVRTKVGQIVWLTRPETLLVVDKNGTAYGPVSYDAPIIHFVSLADGTTGSIGGTRTTGAFPEINFAFDIERLNRSGLNRANLNTSTASVVTPVQERVPFKFIERTVPDVLPFGFPLSPPTPPDSTPVSPSQ
jgi:hypothetical protein